MKTEMTIAKRNALNEEIAAHTKCMDLLKPYKRNHDTGYALHHLQKEVDSILEVLGIKHGRGSGRDE